MRSRNVFLSIGFIAAFLVLLAACGGGGGGGFTPITYTGSTSLATIDGTNAGDFAGLAESGATMPSNVPLPMSVSGGTAASVDIPIPVIQAVIDLGKNAPGLFDSAPAPSNAAAVITFTDTYFCDSTNPGAGTGDGSDGYASVSVSINDVTFDMSATVTYYDCDEGAGVIMNGGMTMAMNLYADPYVAPATINMTLRNLKMSFQDTGETITTYAIISMTEDQTGTYPFYHLVITDMIIQDDATLLTARISNYDVSIIEYTTYDEITIASGSAMARVYDYDLGYVEFYTVTPIKEDPVSGPYEGILRMEGANGSWAEIDFGNDCSVTDNGTFNDGTVSGTFCYVSTP